MMSCEEETESLSCSPHDNNNGGGVSSRLQLLKKSPVSGSKRTRQRVDAGEPRNSYASIPNFCSRPLLQLPCSNGVLSPPPPQPPNSSSSSSSSASSTASNINNNSITTAAASAKMLNELLGRQLKCELDMGSDSTVDSTDVKMNGQQQQQQQQGAMTPNGGSSGVGGGGAVAGGAIAANGTSDNASTGSSGAVGIGVVGGSLVGLLCPDSPPECIGVGGGVSGNNVNRSQLLREILQGKNKDVVVGDNPFVVDGCNGSGRGTTTNNSNNNNSSSSSSSLISQLLKSSSTAASGPNNGVSTTKEDVGGHHYHQHHHHHHSNHNNDEEEEDEEPTGTGLHVLSDESEDDEAMEVVVGGGSSPTEVASTGLQCKMNGSSGGGSVSDGGGPPSPAGRGGDNNNTSLCNSSSNNNNNNNNSSSIANNSSINNNNNNSDLEIKRARVETIVSGMRSSPCRETSSMAAQVNGCKKRKHYQPQQHDSSLLMHHRGGGYPDDPSPPPKHRRVEREILRKQLREIQQQLMQMQQRYCELFEAESSDSEVVGSSQSEEDGAVGGQAEGVVLHADLAKGDAGLPVDAVVKSESPDELKQSSHVDVLDPAHFIDQARRLVSEQEKLALKEAVSSGTDAKFSSFGSLARLASSSSVSPLTLDVDGLAETLKNELTASLALLIDSILTRFVQRRHQGSHHHHHHHNSKPLDITLNKEVLAAATHMLERHSPRTKVIDRGTGAPLSNNNNNNANNTSGGGIGVGGSVAPSSIPTPSSIIGPPRTHSNGFGSPQPFHSVNSSSDNNGGSNKQQSIQSLFAAVSSKPPLSLYNPHSSSSQSQQQQHQQQQHHHQTPSPPLPHHPHHPHNNHPYGPGADASGEQNEALSLVVTPKKKRHKVTDTRITPRTVSRLLSQEPADNNNHHHHNSHHNPQKYSPLVSSTHPDSPYHPPPLVPVSLPTSVAIPNPSLHQSDVFSAYPYYHHPRGGSPAEGLDDDAILHPSANLMHASLLNSAVAAVAAAAGGHGSPDTLGMGHFKSENGEVGSDCNSPDVSFDGSGGPVISFHWRSAFPANDKVFLDSGHSSTLTPMHLRKAKLMFFYVRYPSSSILKMYFPDIKFNKNNTAQLVKWFSNFREFFYIQMEKYARQAISEGLKSADDLSVNGDSELYRVLNLHYNRNNHIEVPANFRFVVEQTLREFFKSIIGGKDSEQSWKKSIYKVIARLDDNLPEYFKSPNFLEQLE